ncbi:MAG TPA: extracellular solute-binding protein [Clostridiales bacterium]|nr:extracellular solute-binding protein [Clostridiales bacterium]
MFNIKKKSCILLALILALSTIAASCSSKDSGTSKNEGSTQSDSNNSSVTTDKEVKTDPPTKLRFMYSTTGTSVPGDVDPCSNPFLNIIAELANVEFTEVIVPPYADYDGKFKLTVASGDMPDVMHDQWSFNEVTKYGIDGAFEPLNNYIANSSFISKIYSPAQIDLMKAVDGNIYGLKSRASGDLTCLEYRRDLIDELNNGVVPETPEGWFDVAKKLKAKYPESIPFSGHKMPDVWMFSSFGVSCAGWQYTNGEFIHCFEAPLIKECIQFIKKAYDEGLLDKNFVTNQTADYLNVMFNKNLLCDDYTYLNVVGDMANAYDRNLNGLIFAPAPLPMKNDSRIDISNVYSGPGLLGGSSLCVASGSEEKEGAFRLIETFCSDEVLNLASWGREGIEYNIVNDEKVLDLENSTKTDYRGMYGIMKYYNYPEQIKVIKAHVFSYFPEIKDSLNKIYDDAWDILEEKLKLVPAVTPQDFLKLEADTLSRKSEAKERAESIILRAIIGEISMEEYDKQVSEFLKKYQSITNEYNKKADEIKKDWKY